MVTISANVDYALVVALIAIVHAMKSTEDEYVEQMTTSVAEVISATAWSIAQVIVHSRFVYLFQ